MENKGECHVLTECTDLWSPHPKYQGKLQNQMLLKLHVEPLIV